MDTKLLLSACRFPPKNRSSPDAHGATKCTIADICFDPREAVSAEVQHLLHFLAAWTGVSNSGTITTTPSGTRPDRIHLRHACWKAGCWTDYRRERTLGRVRAVNRQHAVATSG
jgi:hypothetical protein